MSNNMVASAGSQGEGLARDVGAEGPESSDRWAGILCNAFF